ncbi:HisA/HisF-related TIM barrel protein [Ornithinimicrobium sediminis]|uniref:HisA/HisF-related TIM barrel protein n=1 Tax=Ornithinimicrobium sediminis TaxID=2904603 RepID=UPI001E5DD134|nr:bifunctional 1-(5-phosphoribosyl)-5-((5-phosphoribosylamino)methylideneamino)imidazole-4-carboxamide isomerase/phosphoribosylanthranilate isomerase PriA [Ornithinimicrobium sediminis]
MTSLTLLPAVDVAGGRATQVAAGADADPRAVARRWVQEGAEWIHLVDLDQAFARGTNRDVLASVVAAVPVPVQVSGGIDNDATLRAALATGAERVNLASTAVADLPWVRAVVAEHGSRIAVGLDVRDGDVVARGVDVRLGTLTEVLHALHDVPVSTFVVADANRDGRRLGADIDLFHAVALAAHARVIASGGISDLADVRALRALVPDGVQGLVLGAALHEGAFTLAEALEVAR